MGDMATYENAEGKMVHDGLSILDIVKHATKAVIEMLQPQDRLVLHCNLTHSIERITLCDNDVVVC